MSILGPKTQQNDNQVAGDLVGGNKIGNQFNGTQIVNPQIHLTARVENIFAQLMGKIPNIGQELSEAKEIVRRVSAFDYYFSIEPQGSLLSLEEKLADANRMALLENGLIQKECFAKQIAEHEFSETAQCVYVVLLDKVEMRFQTKILPALRAGCSDDDVLSLIESEIVDPLLSLLPPMDILIRGKSIAGMVYFLTGKCLLRWT